MSKKEIKGDIADLDESLMLVEQGGAPSSPPTGRQKLYLQSGTLRAVNSGGATRNLEESQKNTVDLSSGNVTVTSGNTYWHPNLTIDTGDTYTVDAGATLLSAVELIVNGNLVSNGDTFIL